MISGSLDAGLLMASLVSKDSDQLTRARVSCVRRSPELKDSDHNNKKDTASEFENQHANQNQVPDVEFAQAIARETHLEGISASRSRGRADFSPMTLKKRRKTASASSFLLVKRFLRRYSFSHGSLCPGKVHEPDLI
jgi:hypothetical protein